MAFKLKTKNDFDFGNKSPMKGKISGPCKAAAKRRKSFCARSRSWTSERGKAARRRWNC